MIEEFAPDKKDELSKRIQELYDQGIYPRCYLYWYEGAPTVRRVVRSSGNKRVNALWNSWDKEFQLKILGNIFNANIALTDEETKQYNLYKEAWQKDYEDVGGVMELEGEPQFAHRVIEY